MSADKNYVIVSGNPNGELWLTDPRQEPARQLLRPAGDFHLIEINVGDVIPPDGSYSDALKFSGAENVVVFVKELVGGQEDCIDVNHSHGVEVQVQRATPKGRYVATIKGGSSDIKVIVSEQVGHGRETDFDLGNWSDQSMDKTVRVALYSKPVDGSAAKVRQLHADRPSLSAACKWKLNSWMSPFFKPVMTVLKLWGWA